MLGLRVWTVEFSGTYNMCHGLRVQELQVPARRAWPGQRVYSECPAPSPVWAAVLAKGEMKLDGSVGRGGMET